MRFLLKVHPNYREAIFNISYTLCWLDCLKDYNTVLKDVSV